MRMLSLSPSTGSHDAVLGIPANGTQISPGEAQQLMGASQSLFECKLREDRAVGNQGAPGGTLGSAFRGMGLYGVLGLRPLPQLCTEYSECSQPGDTETW